MVGRRARVGALAAIAAAAIATPVFAFDGELDPGFGGDGIVVTNTPGNAYDRATDVIVDSSERVVAAGWTGDTGDDIADFLVARYDVGGALDDGFDSDGIATTPIGSGNDEANAVAEQADGKLVAVGQVDDGVERDLAVVRYDDDGTLDTSFDGDSGTGNGIVRIATAPGGDDDFYATDVAIQADGKVVVVGAADMDTTDGTNYDMVVMRLNTDGTLDDAGDADPGVTFDTDGIAITDFTGADGFDGANAVAIQDDGRIVAAGDASPDTGDADAAFARYTTQGALDTTFDGDVGSGNGKVLVDFAGGGDAAIDLTIQDDGLLLAAASAGGSIGLTRLESAGGTLDDSLGADGTAVSTFGSGTSGPVVEAVDVLSDGRIVVTGTATTGGGDVDFAFARYMSDGTFDDDFGGDGTVTRGASATIPDRAHGAALTGEDKIVAAGFMASDAPTDRDVEVMRLRDDETAPDTTITKTPKKKVKTKKRRKRVQFEFSSSEAGSTFECQLDDKPPTGCDSPHSFKAKRGKHVFRVTATDGVGNEDQTPAEFSFKVKRKKK
jgi:uncharacterized delta-60 repeat protein